MLERRYTPLVCIGLGESIKLAAWFPDWINEPTGGVVRRAKHVAYCSLEMNRSPNGCFSFMNVLKNTSELFCRVCLTVS